MAERMAATVPGASFLDSISPWASRSTTPKPTDGQEQDVDTAKLSNQKGADHSISHRHRLRLKDYPSDCPKPSTRWFYAVDVIFGNLFPFLDLSDRYYRLPKESLSPLSRLAKSQSPFCRPRNTLPSQQGTLVLLKQLFKS